MRSTLRLNRATILGTSIALTMVGQSDVGFSEPAAELMPSVELNTNVNGCADLHILSSTVRGKNVSVKFQIIDTTDAAQKNDYPCVCNDASTYYFMVYPLDQTVQPEGVVMAKMKPFTRNFSINRHQMQQKKEYIETAEFPFVKNRNSKPFSHYYIAFACRSGP